MPQEARFLTPEQFLLTIFVKLAVMAVLATMLARYHRFRHILIFERRGWVDRLVFMLALGVPLAAGVAFRLTLPHKAFHRAIGNYAGHFISTDGDVLTEAQWKSREARWLPTPADQAFVQSLMIGRVIEPGKFANWIAPPRAGINHQPLDFEYVRFA